MVDGLRRFVEANSQLESLFLHGDRGVFLLCVVVGVMAYWWNYAVLVSVPLHCLHQNCGLMSTPSSPPLPLLMHFVRRNGFSRAPPCRL